MPDVPQLPPIADQSLSVVLVAHNDAVHLEAVVAAWVTLLNSLDREYEVLLVDDGSTDDTTRVLPVLTERHSRVRVLRHAAAQGCGAALRTGLAEARHPLFFYTVCDPRYRPADLKRLLKEIDRVHLVSGYRGGRRVPRFWRWLGAARRGLSRVVLGHAHPPLPGWLGWKRHAGRLVVRLLFGVRNHDVTCPFRLARRAMFTRLPLQSDSAFAHVEILAKATFLGCLLAEEVPLGDRHHPVPAEDSDGDRLSRLLSDAARVFRQPDFGPALAATATVRAGRDGASAPAGARTDGTTEPAQKHDPSP
jgi:glycosyltransferase involved in cell wall biosynthesis